MLEFHVGQHGHAGDPQEAPTRQLKRHNTGTQGHSTMVLTSPQNPQGHEKRGESEKATASGSPQRREA